METDVKSNLYDVTRIRWEGKGSNTSMITDTHAKNLSLKDAKSFAKNFLEREDMMLKAKGVAQ